MIIRLALWAVLASGGLAACTIKTTPDDGGTTTTASAETVDYQCSQIGTAICEALPLCAVTQTTSLSDCVSSYVATCCSSATCGEISGSSDSVLQTCTAAYQQPMLDCNGLANGTTPDVCTGVPAIP